MLHLLMLSLRLQGDPFVQKCLSRHSLSQRFNRLAWGAIDPSRPNGVLAAGMENGELALWDPDTIVAQPE